MAMSARWMRIVHRVRLAWASAATIPALVPAAMALTAAWSNIIQFALAMRDSLVTQVSVALP